ncbi:D-sedoheptulose 7-phosphate isomerase [Aliikangiella sp. G2MR2-5]|uniref:D-sedoheptulose 7-phosphate isomerase n=1 Tax=Aliikangiella sp. G2MR2-5 TaxID=2788943 RepID=UPI0018A94202|nr:D-sedoheptulose 7-phosphate isomerase [Aliikangiella sp. G2MR2-5]
MDNLDFINNYLDSSISVKTKILASDSIKSTISLVAERIICCFKSGGKVVLAGNGGSAADAQHIAAEFVSRFLFDRPGLPSIALTTDTSMLTAIGNDYGFESLFSRQVQAQCQNGDVFIGISTSGESKNIINAVEEAKRIGVTTVGLCGSSGVLNDSCDYTIGVPSDCTSYIQESHICIGHMICAIVEKVLFTKAE